VFLLALGAGIPGAFTALWILWTEPYTPKVQWTLTVLILSTLFGSPPRSARASSCRCRHWRTCSPHFVKTISRSAAAPQNPDDPLGAALIEINALAETLHEQRLGRSKPRRCCAP
jgi:hypothetical protein